MARKCALNGYPAVKIQNLAELQAAHQMGYLEADIGSVICFPDETSRNRFQRKLRSIISQIQRKNRATANEIWTQAFGESL